MKRSATRLKVRLYFWLATGDVMEIVRLTSFVAGTVEAATAAVTPSIRSAGCASVPAAVSWGSIVSRLVAMSSSESVVMKRGVAPLLRLISTEYLGIFVGAVTGADAVAL